MAEARRVAVVTGSRADFGLLTPVMRAVDAHPDLELLVVAAGSHLVAPAMTFRDVKALFEAADSVPMQRVGRTGRWADVEALGHGVGRFGRSFERLGAEWVVVLGDRIEAFAAASAASVGGLAIAHLHGGDRAEGVSDEAMRHAVTKLSHLHLVATEQSGERVRRMGEPEHLVRVVGSPAIDGLAGVEPLDDRLYGELGEPQFVVAMHPIGDAPEHEEARAEALLAALDGERVLALHPNLDPGRDGILRALRGAEERGAVVLRDHLPRAVFASLLKRLAGGDGGLIGNSSAGLIEAPALGCAVVDIGARQAGRERPSGAEHVDEVTREGVMAAFERAHAALAGSPAHPYGDGRAGERAAEAIAGVDPADRAMLRKRNSY